MDVLYWLLLLLIPFLLLFFLRKGTPRLYAIRQVIRMFRKSNAVDPGTAKFQDELGFKPDKYQGNQFISLLFGGLGLREEETKRDALQYLMKADVVLPTPDGRLYLSETKLKTSGLFRE
jgi:hypothetical protein